MSVTRAVLPLPTAEGSANEGKLASGYTGKSACGSTRRDFRAEVHQNSGILDGGGAWEGWKLPSGFIQAGWGQWQKPLEYLPLRSRRSRFIVAPLWMKG